MEGTLELLDQINAATNNQLILEGYRDDSVVPLKYRQVQPVYKVGCRGCDTTDYTARLCVACREAAKNTDTKELEDRIMKIKAEMFPECDGVSKTQKRSHDGSSKGDDESLSKKVSK